MHIIIVASVLCNNSVTFVYKYLSLYEAHSFFIPLLIDHTGYKPFMWRLTLAIAYNSSGLQWNISTMAIHETGQKLQDDHITGTKRIIVFNSEFVGTQHWETIQET